MDDQTNQNMHLKVQYHLMSLPKWHWCVKAALPLLAVTFTLLSWENYKPARLHLSAVHVILMLCKHLTGLRFLSWCKKDLVYTRTANSALTFAGRLHTGLFRSNVTHTTTFSTFRSVFLCLYDFYKSHGNNVAMTTLKPLATGCKLGTNVRTKMLQ